MAYVKTRYGYELVGDYFESIEEYSDQVVFESRSPFQRETLLDGVLWGAGSGFIV